MLVGSVVSARRVSQETPDRWEVAGRMGGLVSGGMVCTCRTWLSEGAGRCCTVVALAWAPQGILRGLCSVRPVRRRVVLHRGRRWMWWGGGGGGAGTGRTLIHV